MSLSLDRYVQKILSGAYRAFKTDIRKKFGDELMWLRVEIGEAIRLRAPAASNYNGRAASLASIEAIVYLKDNPDTAHMLDLPTATLVAMARMGSTAAILYFPFGEPDDEYPRTDTEG